MRNVTYTKHNNLKRASNCNVVDQLSLNGDSNNRNLKLLAEYSKTLSNFKQAHNLINPQINIIGKNGSNSPQNEQRSFDWSDNNSATDRSENSFSRFRKVSEYFTNKTIENNRSKQNIYFAAGNFQKMMNGIKCLTKFMIVVKRQFFFQIYFYAFDPSSSLWHDQQLQLSSQILNNDLTSQYIFLNNRTFSTNKSLASQTPQNLEYEKNYYFEYNPDDYIPKVNKKYILKKYSIVNEPEILCTFYSHHIKVSKSKYILPNNTLIRDYYEEEQQSFSESLFERESSSIQKNSSSFKRFFSHDEKSSIQSLNFDLPTEVCLPYDKKRSNSKKLDSLCLFDKTFVTEFKNENINELDSKKITSLNLKNLCLTVAKCMNKRMNLKKMISFYKILLKSRKCKQINMILLTIALEKKLLNIYMAGSEGEATKADINKKKKIISWINKKNRKSRTLVLSALKCVQNLKKNKGQEFYFRFSWIMMSQVKKQQKIFFNISQERYFIKQIEAKCMGKFVAGKLKAHLLQGFMSIQSGQKHSHIDENHLIKNVLLFTIMLDKIFKMKKYNTMLITFDTLLLYKKKIPPARKLYRVLSKILYTKKKHIFERILLKNSHFFQSKLKCIFYRANLRANLKMKKIFLKFQMKKKNLVPVHQIADTLKYQRQKILVDAFNMLLYNQLNYRLELNTMKSGLLTLSKFVENKFVSACGIAFQQMKNNLDLALAVTNYQNNLYIYEGLIENNRKNLTIALEKLKMQPQKRNPISRLKKIIALLIKNKYNTGFVRCFKIWKVFAGFLDQSKIEKIIDADISTISNIVSKHSKHEISNGILWKLKRSSSDEYIPNRALTKFFNRLHLKYLQRAEYFFYTAELIALKNGNKSMVKQNLLQKISINYSKGIERTLAKSFEQIKQRSNLVLQKNNLLTNIIRKNSAFFLFISYQKFLKNIQIVKINELKIEDRQKLFQIFLEKYNLMLFSQKQFTFQLIKANFCPTSSQDTSFSSDLLMVGDISDKKRSKLCKGLNLMDKFFQNKAKSSFEFLYEILATNKMKKMKAFKILTKVLQPKLLCLIRKCLMLIILAQRKHQIHEKLLGVHLKKLKLHSIFQIHEKSLISHKKEFMKQFRDITLDKEGKKVQAIRIHNQKNFCKILHFLWVEAKYATVSLGFQEIRRKSNQIKELQNVKKKLLDQSSSLTNVSMTTNTNTFSSSTILKPLDSDESTNFSHSTILGSNKSSKQNLISNNTTANSKTISIAKNTQNIKQPPNKPATSNTKLFANKKQKFISFLIAVFQFPYQYIHFKIAGNYDPAYQNYSRRFLIIYQFIFSLLF